MRDQGFECLYRSDDLANYARDDERVDFLFAHRPLALQYLEDAAEDENFIRFVPLEGLIAFKLQAFNNDPRRIVDLDDMIQLLRIHNERFDRDRLKAIFKLFNREDLYDDILEQIAD